MNILYLDWPCFGYIDILFTFEHTFKHHVTRFFTRIIRNVKAKILWMPLMPHMKHSILIFVSPIIFILYWRNAATDII